MSDVYFIGNKGVAPDSENPEEEDIVSQILNEPDEEDECIEYTEDGVLDWKYLTEEDREILFDKIANFVGTHVDMVKMHLYYEIKDDLLDFQQHCEDAIKYHIASRITATGTPVFCLIQSISFC